MSKRLRAADSYEYDERPEPLPLLVLPAGKWDMVHAASVFDGSPIGIDHIDRVETA